MAAGPDGNVWIAETDVSKIARVTPAGDITEFDTPTAFSLPRGIVTGPDGNLWFGEGNNNAIGRITPAGVITEFPTNHGGGAITVGPDGALWWAGGGYQVIGRITTSGVATEFPALGSPAGIATGPDGNLWYTEEFANKIARITTAGVVTEFTVPTANVQPHGIVAGPDGNLWFTEHQNGAVGQITTAGVITEIGSPAGDAIVVGPDGNLWFSAPVDVVRFTPSGLNTYPWAPVPGDYSRSVCAGPDGNIWFERFFANEIVRVTPTQLPASLVIMDGGNGVVEPGETFTVSPHWRNWASTIQLNGTAGSFAGPGPGSYSVLDGAASYATVAADTPVDCASASGDCYQFSLSDPGTRPVQHWDATFVETLDSHETKTWKLHVGRSFADVPSSVGTYRFVETIFHNGITGGCSAGNFCPADPVTRQQIAVFLLVAEHKVGYAPPPCTTPAFSDVPCSSGFAKWINQLVAENVTAGCGPGLFCPTTNVTRAQMSVFLLRSFEGSTYVPPACVSPTFSDVPCSSGFSPWIEELVRRGVTAGCAPGLYCPGNPVTRAQMAVFLTTAFGLTLYGP
jgi:streptogramin lyase